MFNLTPQERRVILFLLSMALLGLAINFGLKANSRLATIVRTDEHLTRVNLNQVTSQDLLSLPGITPKLADKILAYRSIQGQFKDISELKEIKGIGDYRYERLKGLFYVE